MDFNQSGVSSFWLCVYCDEDYERGNRMKGNPEIIKTLNSLLSDELSAINQYIVHAEMNANWGYVKLHDHFEKRSIKEMIHAEKLIERILFLEGIPIVSNLHGIKIGKDAPAQLGNDHTLEMDAIKAYNDAIAQAGELKDFATREVLEVILQDEDRHLDEIEELQDQISHMTLPLFLTTQL
ncbi:MAG: bacterioferritin [Clostridiaceae bacterium]